MNDRTLTSNPKDWRCFHCDEVFTNEGKARAHFGETPASVSACQPTDEIVRDLLKKIRALNREVEQLKGTEMTPPEQVQSVEQQARDIEPMLKQTGWTLSLSAIAAVIEALDTMYGPPAHETLPVAAPSGGHTVFCDHCDASALLPYTDATKSSVAIGPMQGWNIETRMGVMCPKCASKKAKVVLPTCAHGATSEEVCPECMGLPSDNPDEEIS